jgi:photosystem II stability/assembly factor-like uncharacterized protein
MNNYLLTISLLIILSACKKKERYTFHFTSLDTPTQASIRGLSVINENNLWISGSGGSVFRTNDGGKSWIDCSISKEKENDFRSLHAFDSLRAIVIGINNPAIIYSTINGGNSWTEMDSISATGLFFNSLKFNNSTEGLAVSDPVDDQFFVIQTKDGGQNWIKCKLPKALKGESNFAASNTCIEYLAGGKVWIACGGPKSQVYKTNDNGLSWQAITSPITSKQAADGIYSICFRNEKQGMIVGGNYQYPNENDSIACYSFDGGESWNLAQKMPSGFRSCVQYFADKSDTIAVAMGKTGFDYSFDDGVNWHKGGTNGYYTIRAIPGLLKGYAAGADGRVAYVSIYRY